MTKYIIIKIIIIFIFFIPVVFMPIQYAYASIMDENITPYLKKAYDAEAKGDIEAAIVWYKKIISIDPIHEQSYINLALLYERKGALKIAAFYWMKIYRLGKEDDFWIEEARERLERLGLIDKRELESTIIAEKRYFNEHEQSGLEKSGRIEFNLAESQNKKDESVKKTLRNIETELSMEYQMVSGEQTFKVIQDNEQILSKLTYPIESDIFDYMFNLRGEVRFHPKFSIGGKYGSSNFSKTTCSDEDWNFWGIHNSEVKYIDYQITKQDCKPSLESFDINLYWRVLDLKDATTTERSRSLLEVDHISLDIFGGYQQQKGRYIMQDPTIEYSRVVDDTLWEAVGLPLYYGLDSPYKVTYRGPRLGLRFGAGNKKLSARMNFSYACIKTKAHGWWNLRDYAFSQYSSHLGYALNLDLDIRYHFNTDWFIGAGYSYTEYNQDKLKESGVQPGYTYDDLDIIRDVDNKVYGPSIIIGKIW
ncbi:MAG: hypothetical protein KJ952_02930 [Candidatus Omnitrophica bacterium]|nr:hypothetical protein [Candidatus Omnitrophota bacterium]